MPAQSVFDIIFHFGENLKYIIEQYGTATYIIMFIIIFCETGLVVTPFLPGDSLIFAAGAFAAGGSLDLGLIMLIISSAALLGDSTNYWIGRLIGKKLFRKEKSLFFNVKNLKKTEAFYAKHGRKTIIIARIIPVIRTFSPFVAGVGKMPYGRFLTFSVIAAFGWVALFSLGGFLFGNLPIIKKNFSLVMLLIVFISVLPVIIAFIKNRLSKRRKKMPQE